MVFHRGEEHRLRVLENRVLRKAVGSTKDTVTQEWRRLLNMEIHDLYCSLNIIWVIKLRGMRWAGNVAYKGDRRGAYRILVGQPDGKRPLERPRCNHH